MLRRAPALVAAALALLIAAASPAAGTCDGVSCLSAYQKELEAALCSGSLADALPGDLLDAALSDVGLFKLGLELSGQKDKLPDPNLGLTLLIPTNNAFLKLLFEEVKSSLLSFSLPDLDLASIADQLPAVLAHNVITRPVSPTDLAAGPGKALSAYGLLTGSGATIGWSPDGGAGKFWTVGVSGAVADVVTSMPPVKICNSWIYIVDDVLLPTEQLKDVQPVSASQVDAAVGAIAGPDGAVAPAAAAPAPVDGCTTTLSEAAAALGLSALPAVLQRAPGAAAALPPLSPDSTFFLPSDAAFLGALSALGLSYADALALGPKMTSLLLYHVVPGPAITSPDGLVPGTELQTALPGKTLDVGEGPTLIGEFPGNEARVQQSTTVCGAGLHVVSAVLVPAPTVAEIPDYAAPGGAPGPAPAGDAGAGEAAVATLSAGAPGEGALPGRGAAVTGTLTSPGGGVYAGCVVRLVTDAGAARQAVSDASGAFAFPCEAAAEGCEGGSVAMLDLELQPAQCVDTATAKAPVALVQPETAATGEDVTLSVDGAKSGARATAAGLAAAAAAAAAALLLA